MALAININELIHGKVIEWERLEFKKGLNPEDLLHSLCAFANDLNNWGGGYIIIGIEENNGRPVLPPTGLNQDEIDRLQGKITELCNFIKPSYLPIVQPYIIEGRHILVLYAPAGDVRPYSAPESLGYRGQKNRFLYIRSGSRTIKANVENTRRLQELSPRVPFDDRINHRASLDDLNLGLIRDFLHEIKSDLAEESTTLPFADLCRKMNIAKGPDEYLLPVNVGLMFFCKEPEKFFDRAWIEVVIRTDEAGKNFTEKYFNGPLHLQLQNALSFIRNNLIIEKVSKVSGQAEALRFYNFPYDAIEEALANAVYHKSYELSKPIEVQIWPDKIEILSFPGPVPPISASTLAKNNRMAARDYRNRRVGDFLKELHLTEGRGTGIPSIYKVMKANGSPDAVFETDSQCTYFLAILPANPEFHSQMSNQQNIRKDSHKQDDDVSVVSGQNSVYFTNIQQVKNAIPKSNQVGNQVSNQVSNQEDNQVSNYDIFILQYCRTPKSRKDVLYKLGMSNQTKNYKNHIEPLITKNWLRMTIPESPTNRNQKYLLTKEGMDFLIANKTE